MSAAQQMGCAVPHLIMSSAAVPPVGDAGMDAFPKKPRWPPSDVSDFTGDAAKALPKRLDESPPEDCRQHEEQCREQPAVNLFRQAARAPLLAMRALSDAPRQAASCCAPAAAGQAAVEPQWPHLDARQLLSRCGCSRQPSGSRHATLQCACCADQCRRGRSQVPEGCMPPRLDCNALTQGSALHAAAAICPPWAKQATSLRHRPPDMTAVEHNRATALSSAQHALPCAPCGELRGEWHLHWAGLPASHALMLAAHMLATHLGRG